MPQIDFLPHQNPTDVPRVQRVRVDLGSSTVSATAAYFDVDQPCLEEE